MRTKGAVIRSAPGAYEIVDLELDEPRQGEITVKMVAAGLCHSDDHVATGDVPVSTYPLCGGHEGAGIVEHVGSGTPGFAEGDHVVFSFLPACGRCRFCSRGQQNLCDLGAVILHGSRAEDPSSYRMHLDSGANVGQMSGVSTFSEYTTVDVRSAVKLDPELPLDKMCLLGCCVGTGFGSAVNSAGVEPGDVVIIMGAGGIGMNAVQGAAVGGACIVIAVDPVGFKRDQALAFGATHVFEDIAEAAEFAKSQTNGQGADSAIVSVGITDGSHVASALSAIREGGVVVVTGVGDLNAVGVPISIGELTLFQKRIQGSLFGATNPFADIPRQVQMYREGKLKLDELITRTYSLDEINVGYDDLRAGRNIRGLIMF